MKRGHLQALVHAKGEHRAAVSSARASAMLGDEHSDMGCENVAGDTEVLCRAGVGKKLFLQLNSL